MVLLEAGRVKQSELLGDILDEGGRLRNLLSGSGRIHVDRSDIKSEVGGHLLQIKTANAVDVRRIPGRLEFNLGPRTPLACLENDLVLTDLDDRGICLPVAMD